MSVSQFIQKGEYIFQEGNYSDSAFIIEYGSVEIIEKDDNGVDQVIGVLHSNDLFGEMGLIDGLPRSASARAAEDTKIHILSKEIFDSLCKHNPDVIIPILKVLTHRLRETLHLLKSGYKLPGRDRRQNPY